MNPKLRAVVPISITALHSGEKFMKIGQKNSKFTAKVNVLKFRTNKNTFSLIYDLFSPTSQWDEANFAKGGNLIASLCKLSSFPQRIYHEINFPNFEDVHAKIPKCKGPRPQGRDANHSDFCEIIPIFKANFPITISNIKITANGTR